MNLRSRIGRLEGRTANAWRGSMRCAVCCVAPADPVVYKCEPPRVIGEDAGDEQTGPEACDGCGRVLVYGCEPPRELALVTARGRRSPDSALS